MDGTVAWREAIEFVLDTDQGPVTIPVPAALMHHGVMLIRSVEFKVRGNTIFILPMYSHGVPLHTICTIGDDDEDDDESAEEPCPTPTPTPPPLTPHRVPPPRTVRRTTR